MFDLDHNGGFFYHSYQRGNVIDRTSIPAINYYANTRRQQENIFIGIVMLVWFRYGWHYQYTIHSTVLTRIPITYYTFENELYSQYMVEGEKISSKPSFF